MISVRELLQIKGGQVWTVAPDISVFQALEIMAEKNVGAVLVTEQDKLVGIFTERDYARGVRLKGKSSTDTLLRELMTTNVVFVSPENKMKECMALMTDKRVRHIPVLEDGRLIGIISIGDIVKQVISDQEFTIRELEKYITGSY